jgi:hypothetical protein
MPRVRCDLDALGLLGESSTCLPGAAPLTALFAPVLLQSCCMSGGGVSGTVIWEDSLMPGRPYTTTAATCKAPFRILNTAGC